jgi:hypothetical protein
MKQVQGQACFHRTSSTNPPSEDQPPAQIRVTPLQPKDPAELNDIDPFEFMVWLQFPLPIHIRIPIRCPTSHIFLSCLR